MGQYIGDFNRVETPEGVLGIILIVVGRAKGSSILKEGGHWGKGPRSHCVKEKSKEQVITEGSSGKTVKKGKVEEGTGHPSSLMVLNTEAHTLGKGDKTNVKEKSKEG